MSNITYAKSNRYPDLATIYAECSGPGGLQLTEFLAEKMQLAPGKRLLDIGIERGYQTCFLAKEYGVFAVAIDPDVDQQGTIPPVE
jgi:cyclopropane fatty-acyl-phospholipid synthase-like methyltransferase